MSNQFIYVPFKSRGELSAISADISSDNDISSFVNNKITAMSVDARLATLSSNIMTAVEEMSTTIELSTLDSYDASYNISALYPLSAHNTGDIAIIKKPISADHYEYSTYVANKKLSVWEPMTGGYNAKNVYFSDDIVITQPFGKYKPTTANPKLTLSSANKSVWDIFYESLHVAESGNTTQPSITIAQTADKSGWYTQDSGVLTCKLTFNRGSYSYGPTDTAVKVDANNAYVKISDSETTLAYKTNENQIVNGGTLTASTSTGIKFPGRTSASGSNPSTTITCSISAYHTAGVTANDSLGGPDSNPSKTIGAGSCVSQTGQIKLTGKMPFWYAFDYSNITLSKSDVDNLISCSSGQTKTIKGVTFIREEYSSATITKTATSAWYNLYVIVPNWFSKWEGSQSSGVPIDDTSKDDISIYHYDNSTKGDYRMFRSYCGGLPINPGAIKITFS